MKSSGLTRIVLTTITFAAAGCGGGGSYAEVTDKPPVVPSVPDTPRPGSFALREVARGLDSPVYAAAPAEGDDLFIVERSGFVRILRGGRIQPRPFLDISSQVRTEVEEGLHSIAFHHDFASNGRLYAHFNDRQGDIRVVEYTASGDRVDPDTARELLRIDKPEGVRWHNGGQLQIGPDRKLYIGVGDSARNPLDGLRRPPRVADPTNNGQNLALPFGKIVRLDPELREEPEVIAYGLRNPWRFSFDSSGGLFVADVGQHEWEELDYLPTLDGAPFNFGWSVFEGTARYKPAKFNSTAPLKWPIVSYQHGGYSYCSRGRGSITGGYAYRGAGVPKLAGRYVFGDFCSGEIWSLVVRDGQARDLRKEPIEVPLLVSFGEDSNGELYALSLHGRVYAVRRS